jgi:hypothetical protein
MLKIICKHEQMQDIIQYLSTEIKDLVISTDFEALTFSYMDEDEALDDAIWELFEESSNGITFDGIIFDREDSIGTEPYGFVYDFFEGYLFIVKELKKKFPDIGIEGEVFVYEHGVMDYVYRQRVHCTPRMKSVKFIDQTQCTMCEEWFDVKDVDIIYEDDECGELYELNEDFCMTPSGYFNGRKKAAFCMCKSCAEALGKNTEEDEDA